MRIGDAISSSANRRTAPDRYQRTYPYTNYKTYRKSQNHGNYQKTEQIGYSNKGQILAQRIQPDGSIQFLFKEDITSLAKWETKEKMALEYQEILEKYEKQQQQINQNDQELRKGQEQNINGKRRYGNDGEQNEYQFGYEKGSKKQFIEDRENDNDYEEDQDQDLNRGLNGNFGISNEEYKKEIKKIDLKELFKDVKESDDDSHSEEQKKEEVQERINNSQQAQEVKIVENNTHKINENNQKQIPLIKIQETPLRKIKKNEENTNKLDILDEFRFVETESSQEIDIESDDMEQYQQQRTIQDNVEEQKNNQDEKQDFSSQQLKKSQEKDMQQTTKLVSEQYSSSKQQQQLPQNGDFSYGDKVKRIRSCQRKEGILLIDVEWLPRCDGSIPNKSTVPSSVFRQYDPHTLLDFYESKLSFPAKKTNNNKQ